MKLFFWTDNLDGGYYIDLKEHFGDSEKVLCIRHCRPDYLMLELREKVPSQHPNTAPLFGRAILSLRELFNLEED